MNNALTVLLLVVLFPVGILRLWSRKCRWSTGLKYALSCVGVGVFAAALIILPGLKKPVRGGIELVGSDPSVEVYGPEAPENIVEAHVPQTTSASVLDTSGSEDTTLYVYAADGSACYHMETCRYAYASSKRLTIYEAHFLGYKPCNICRPPEYAGMLDGGATEAPAAVETEAASELE